jgi:hypothetical protein
MDRAFYDSLKACVRHTMLTAWDPIGLRDLPADIQAANSDEYDSYVQPIIDRARRHPDQDDLAAFLREIESRDMGIKPSRSRAGGAARAIIDILQKA